MSNKLDETDIKPTETFSGGPLPEEMIATNSFRGMNLFLLLIIAMAMIPWIFGADQIFDFNISGWTWVIPASLAGLVCMTNIRRIAFPVWLWLPWIGLICLYWFLGQDNPDALQSLLQMLAPLAVGCAVSIFRPDSLQMGNIVRWISRLAWITWIFLLIRMPMIITGVIPDYGFMTAEMIGLLLFGACYAAFYACGSGRYLYYYLAMLMITVISLTRGPILAMLSCLPLTPAPLNMRKRVLLCVGIIVCALILFNTDRVQERMFFSGSGGLADLNLDNPDFRTTGRSAMWEVLWYGVEQKPMFGHGWNFHRFTISIVTSNATYAPHNDWLKLLYDIGIVGAGLYLITMVLQLFYLVRIARRSTGAQQMLAYGAATVFVPYALIMLTDNVMLYVQFFGNLHFALIGIVFGALRRSKETGYA